jgi:Copper binding proteins, plastocyanin/azurin family
MRTLALAFALVAAALLPAATAADNPQLVGTVGPGFDISLVDGAGNDVHHLDPGTYDLLVHDRADIHNFHLTGPGVNVSTEIDFTGDWKAQVTLRDGTYTFLCDPHNTAMRGTFTVGTPPTTTVAKPKPKPKAIAARVGPGATLAFPAKLASGRYVVTVRDLSARDNLHLKGVGVNRKTGVAARGTTRWTVTLVSGRYRVWSDAHPKVVRTVTVR